MRPERHPPRSVARTLVDILARNSVHRDPPGSPDPHGMLTVVDPQVPESDRELLRYADPAHLAHARAHPLRQLRRSRWHAPDLPHLNDEEQARSAKSLSWAAKGAGLGTLIPLAMGALPVLTIGEMISLAPLAMIAACGWAMAALSWWDFIWRTGLRRRPRVESAAAAAHRHPSHFLLPQDLGEQGRALVARADRMIDNAQVHERIPDQAPVLWEHLWRLAEGVAAHERARCQGAEKEALAESWAVLERHVERLRVLIHQALDQAPAAEEAATVDTGPQDATRELRARMAGIEASINELGDPDNEQDRR